MFLRHIQHITKSSDLSNQIRRFFLLKRFRYALFGRNYTTILFQTTQTTMCVLKFYACITLRLKKLRLFRLIERLNNESPPTCNTLSQLNSYSFNRLCLRSFITTQDIPSVSDMSESVTGTLVAKNGTLNKKLKGVFCCI